MYADTNGFCIAGIGWASPETIAQIKQREAERLPYKQK